MLGLSPSWKLPFPCYCWRNSNLPALCRAIFPKSSTVFLYQDKQKRKKICYLLHFTRVCQGYTLHSPSPTIIFLWNLQCRHLLESKLPSAGSESLCLWLLCCSEAVGCATTCSSYPGPWISLPWTGSCQLHYLPVSTSLVFPSSSSCE